MEARQVARGSRSAIHPTRAPRAKRSAHRDRESAGRRAMTKFGSAPLGVIAGLQPEAVPVAATRPSPLKYAWNEKLLDRARIREFAVMIGGHKDRDKLSRTIQVLCAALNAQHYKSIGNGRARVQAN